MKAPRPVSTDAIINGKINIAQFSDGYRFSVDPILLADFARIKRGEKVADLGTGSGIIPVILASKNPGSRFWGVEIQNDMADIAGQNIISNGVHKSTTIIKKDMHGISQKDFGGPVDVIITNPPYRPLNKGRLNSTDEKSIARHEIHVTLKSLVETALKLIRTKGRFYAIYPVWRMAEMIHELNLKNCSPKRIRMVHGYRESEATLFMIEAVKAGGPGLTIDPPLILYDAEGIYTLEAERICGRPHKQKKTNSK